MKVQDNIVSSAKAKRLDKRAMLICETTDITGKYLYIVKCIRRYLRLMPRRVG
jgi:hypothetical protein